MLQPLSMDTEWTVSFILLHGTDETSFKDPDFIIRRGVGASELLIAVGETQSDNWDAVMQVGVSPQTNRLSLNLQDVT